MNDKIWLNCSEKDRCIECENSKKQGALEVAKGKLEKERNLLEMEEVEFKHFINDSILRPMNADICKMRKHRIEVLIEMIEELEGGKEQ